MIVTVTDVSIPTELWGADEVAVTRQKNKGTIGMPLPLPIRGADYWPVGSHRGHVRVLVS